MLKNAFPVSRMLVLLKRDLAGRQLANRLQDFPIQAIYSSDLKRSIHTASIIASKHSLTLQIEPLFREICFGEWEGLRWEEIDPENSKEQIRDVVRQPYRRFLEEKVFLI